MTSRRYKDFKTVNVIQGDFHVSEDENVVLTTVLGSCVAACLFDPVSGVGGMNHFLLPGDPNNPTLNKSYGLNAMELLINTMLKKGAKRNRFQAKLFGGAAMSRAFSDIGAQNVAFAKEFLKREGFPCVSQSLGGENARRVRFWPMTGQAQLKILSDTSIKEKLAPKPVVVPDCDIELF